MRNPAGIKAHQKAGFREIGRRRECRIMGGKLWDEVHMDCLSSEFESRVLRGIYAPDNELSSRNGLPVQGILASLR